MPKEQAALYRVVKSFDFSPRLTVVQSFAAGEEHAGLTKAVIEYGTGIGALEPVTEAPASKEKRDG